MPELPEVEAVRRGLEDRLVGKSLTEVRVREPRLRRPVPPLSPWVGRRLLRVERRGKYLLWRFDEGTLLVHLGMSGHFAFAAPEVPPGRHDHVDFLFEENLLRYTDPRRFGLILPLDAAAERALEARLGLEPWDARLTPALARERVQERRRAIKEVLLAGDVVVGAGNIYACEALFHAGIHPDRPAGTLGEEDWARLLAALRAVFEAAIAAGGTTLRDHRTVEGKGGEYRDRLAVYGREGEPCPRCAEPVRRVLQGGRSTFFCPVCQSPGRTAW